MFAPTEFAHNFLSGNVQAVGVFADYLEENGHQDRAERIRSAYFGWMNSGGDVHVAQAACEAALFACYAAAGRARPLTKTERSKIRAGIAAR